LQRELDVDVNMLLFCAWLGAAHGSVLSAERIGFFADIVRSWHEDVVKPLRLARDTLKGRADFAETDIGALRGRVLSVELDAEQIEQALLFQAALQNMPEAAPHTAAAVRANVLTYLQSKAPAADRGDPVLPAALLAAAEAVVRHDGLKNL
ncbi:MAG: TIGR02444 family protein, partial [Candidatus Binataceae bacterium]